MNAIDLAKKITLDPRAVVLTGALRERTKMSDAGQISGFSPHFAVKGCPMVQFDAAGESTSFQQEAAAIEADFTEQHTRPQASAIASGYGRPLNMVHLLFGRQGASANPAESKVLKEAGEILRSVAGIPTYLVAMPVFTSAPYGVAAGRLFPLGVFNQAGESLWLNPLAVGSFLQASYPANQVQRSVVPAPVVVAAPAAPTPPKSNWYDVMSTSLGKATKLSGKPLHNLVLGQYADQLVISGRAKNKTEATEIAREEFDTYKNANSAPLPSLSKAPVKKLTNAKV